MIIQINPLDTIFFRDGKPFTMAEDTWSDTIFPPYPSVIYGAIRSAYFSEHIDELEKAGNDNDLTKSLKIKGIYYGIGIDVYFPLPLDCVKEKNNNDKQIKVTALTMGKNNSQNNCLTEYLLSDKNERKVENVPDGLIRKSMFQKYLDDASESFQIQKINDYVISEPKVGIGRSAATHSIEESKLYRVGMKRLEGKSGVRLSIVVDFEGLDLPENGLIKLGGEGKAANYKKYKNNISVDAPKFEQNEKRFKMILTTPAIFTNGWLPSWIDKKTLEGDYNGLKLKLLTAAIGKPINIGGFDMKAKRPKAMFKAVPAGSVYYFKIAEGDIRKIISLFHQKAISDVYPEQGFGIAYVGKTKEDVKI